MSELLTQEDYESVRESIDFPQAAFIDGRYQAGSGAPLAAVNPATGATLCTRLQNENRC